MREIKREFQVKHGRGWVTDFVCTDPKQVYEDLSHELIAKKINNCDYIRSIKRTNNYDGTQTIIVTYSLNFFGSAGRNVYIIN